MLTPDRDYHRRRVEQELDRATAATSICAQRVHLELAQLHAQRACARGDALVIIATDRSAAAPNRAGGNAPAPRIIQNNAVAFNDR